MTKDKVSKAMQIFLKWAVPTIVIFSVFYSISATYNEKQLIIVDYTTNDVGVLTQLKEKGAINNMAYFAGRIAVELGFDIESGGFELSRSMGPVSFLAAAFSPEFKYVAFNEGMRKEQMVDILSKKLDWSEEDKRTFTNDLPICAFTGGEGYLYPGTYLIHKNESPKDVRFRMEKELYAVISDITNNPDEEVLNLKQVLTIASLIQREAAGKEDMRLISGVIWNRLFLEMPLQIDATLQYVKASEDNGWWPQVRADDKYLLSPYNTYQNKGLPPGPIANPGKSAIEAALNPADTTCLFYLHDNSRNIHCATTYEKHKQNVSYYLK
ncbi:endolytic transglycosylase MltG [Candidatus Pacebacteria bacterium]|nr:endolytic transglycosylase MltG [Candidatus Paceibacterota bacterium]